MVSHSSLTLQFENTEAAKTLFGQYDENLAYLEKQIGVELIAQGNQLTIQAAPARCDEAAFILERVYSLILDGPEMSAADVRGAMLIKSQEGAPTNALNQEVFPFAQRADADIARITTRKRSLAARNKAQQAYIEAMQKSTMVFGVGPAGTGKTYLAAAQAVALLEAKEVGRIILSRPAVEAGERIGFLPGDMKEKVDPYLRPLYDAIHDMMPSDKVERAINSGVIEIAPLAFMRGRTLGNAAVVLDEAQNTTRTQMKMFLTRLGEGGRMFITGDPSQVDLPRGEPSGLHDALDKLNTIQDISIIRFGRKDVVRHPLVERIVTAYDGKD